MTTNCPQKQACDLYLNGMSMNAVGKELGVAGQTVRRWLDAAGISIRYSRPTYSDSIRREAIRIYQEEKLSCKKVADLLNLKTFTVKEWVSAAGVIRSQSDAASLAIAGGDTIARRQGTHIWYKSEKTGIGQYAESSMEYLRMKQLDKDPSVASWGRCSRRIPYIAPNGKNRNYIPDFEVLMSDGSIVIEEVKPFNFIGHPINQAKFKSAISYCDDLRISFCVKTESDTGYSRSLTPVYLSVEEQRERRNKLRRDRWARETPDERKLRLKKNADYMREYHRRKRQESRDDTIQAPS